MLNPESIDPPEDDVVSRFLAKVALEVFADRLIRTGVAVEPFALASQFDAIREHVMNGIPAKWAYYLRRLHPADEGFLGPDGTWTERVCEFDLLLVEQRVLADGSIVGELFLILGLWGWEFTISLGHPDVATYVSWLEKHDFQTPLAFGNNAGRCDPHYMRTRGSIRGAS